MIQPALLLDGAEGTPLRTFAARLQSRNPPPPLAPKEPWNEGLLAVLQGADAAELVGKSGPAAPADQAALCGLMLWNDALSDAHGLCQNLEDATGSYWHAIMHRREPDFPNAKYWFRRVGDFPTYPDLREQALGVFTEAEAQSENALEKRLAVEANPAWDPFRFVDWCAEAVNAPNVDPAAVRLLEAVQLREIELLLSHCWRVARSASAP